MPFPEKGMTCDMKKTIFTGAGVAIVTPMRGDGTLDFDRIVVMIFV